MLGAALTHKVDIIAEITADCPLIDPKLIDIAIQRYLENDFDYVANTIDRQFADGMDVQIFSTNFLRTTYSPDMAPFFLEHVTAHIVKSDQFNRYNITANPEQYGPSLRITLDTETDYKIIRHVYTKLVEKKLEINCENVMRFLK